MSRSSPVISSLFAVVAYAVCATTLAAVAGITVAVAASLAHDLAPSLRRRLCRSPLPELRRARYAVLLVGAVAVVLSVWAQNSNPQVLFAFTFVVAASALAPVLLCSLFWTGMTAHGARWGLYGTPLSFVATLMALSPAVSGTPSALFPDRDFHVFPLQTPGLVTVPVGFALCLLGSGRRRTPEEEDLPQADHAPLAQQPPGTASTTASGGRARSAAPCRAFPAVS
ncbi:hypothetical protein ACF068_07290 [Streptomyces sp. NPDC016309]|uniref:sodium:solute symporter family transporter n=1 Tax=Streptomyces sp. NPDC016309 TaxID=3364965 RepID=UPI0036F93325